MTPIGRDCLGVLRRCKLRCIPSGFPDTFSIGPSFGICQDVSRGTFDILRVMKQPIKSTSVLTRVTAKQRALIQKAALLSNRTVADYIRILTLKQAERDIAAAAAKASEPSVAVAQTD